MGTISLKTSFVLLRIAAVALGGLGLGCTPAAGLVNSWTPSPSTDRVGMKAEGVFRIPRPWLGDGMLVGIETAWLPQVVPWQLKDQARAGLLVGKGTEPAPTRRVGFEGRLHGGIVVGSVAQRLGRRGGYAGLEFAVPWRVGGRSEPWTRDSLLGLDWAIAPQVGADGVWFKPETGHGHWYPEFSLGVMVRASAWTGLLR